MSLQLQMDLGITVVNQSHEGKWEEGKLMLFQVRQIVLMKGHTLSFSKFIKANCDNPTQPTT